MLQAFSNCKMHIMYHKMKYELHFMLMIKLSVELTLYRFTLICQYVRNIIIPLYVGEKVYINHIIYVKYVHMFFTLQT